jgi:hypothetical protein
LLDDVEEILGARITARGEHVMEALARLFRFCGEALNSGGESNSNPYRKRY